MKRLICIWYILAFCRLLSLQAVENEPGHYQDSILKVAEALTSASDKLSYLREMAYLHQYPPYNKAFSISLYEEALRRKDVYSENLGAYYLAGVYDKKHDPDSISYWVGILKEYAPRVSTYDYYLEQKAAISRALASKRQIEKAVYVAKETLDEADKYKSNNGKIAAFNSLACAYSVSKRYEEALKVLLQAYDNFQPGTKTSLKVDVLSRIAQIYGNSGRSAQRLPYLNEMDSLLQAAITREPQTRKNWANFEVDCELKYILHFMNRENYDVALEHIRKVKKLLGPHVDPVFWLNVQLIQLQYYSNTRQYDESIALIDEVTPNVLNNYVSTFGTLITYKASTQYKKGDIDGAIETRRYLIHKEDSLNNAFSTDQLAQVKEIYHINELLVEKQKIQDRNYKQGITFLLILVLLILLFYFYTRYLSGKIAATERMAAEAAREAEAENATKERLKSEISHDVRTRLNAVVGFAELLTESTNGFSAETKQEYSRIIQSNAESLLLYINSILELSRLESGKIQYKPQDCEVMELCRRILHTLRQKNESLQITLQTEVESQMVCTDPQWFEMLLSSLLTPMDNATEYLPVTVSVERSADKPMLRFDIINSPLAIESFENKTRLIRHEINTHFVRHFGGTYHIEHGTDNAPAVLSFTIPFTVQSE